MRIGRVLAGVIAAVALLSAPAPTCAQASSDATGDQGAAVVGKNAAASQDAKAAIGRWFEVQSATLLARYRRVETSAGQVTNNQAQDSIALKARFKFDEKARYTVNLGIGTGSSFTSGWNNTGIGTGDRAMDLHVKQLFFAAAPADLFTVAVGSFGFARGESTEITTYDNDGYLVGERVSVKRPNQMYFDEVSFTNAYLGDLDNPGFAGRYRRFDEPNYRQALVSKRLADWLGISGDYTRLDGVGIVHAALAAKTRPARIIDTVRYEQYRRGGPAPGFGYCVGVEKAIGRRVLTAAGWADIDAAYGGLNADRYNAGRRVYAQSDVTLTRDLTTWIFVARAVHNAFAVPNRTRIDVVVTYNVLGPLQRAGLFR